MKYECVRELNPLLSDRPELVDIIALKVSVLSWISPALAMNTTLTEEERQTVFMPGNALMIGVVMNNLEVLQDVKNNEKCKKIG